MIEKINVDRCLNKTNLNIKNIAYVDNRFLKTTCSLYGIKNIIKGIKYYFK